MGRFARHWYLAAFAVLILALLHHSALWSGNVLAAEDVCNLFWCDKYRLRNLWLGNEAWSFWDPLTNLGIPRLANLQVGWFNLENLYFCWLEPVQAWRFYPFLSDLAVLASFYYLLRPSVSREAALLGAGFYLLTADCMRAVQDPPVRTILVAVAIMLGANRRWLASGRRRHLIVLGLMAGWQMVACAVSQLYYEFLVLPFVCCLQIYYCTSPLRIKRGLVAILTFVGATLTFAFPYVPLMDWSAHGSRKMLSGFNFSEAYRFTVPELFHAFFCDEPLVFGPVRFMEYGPGYPQFPEFSLAVTLLVAYACRRPGQRAAAGLALFFALQTLGERGGYLWILHKLFPFTEQFRDPHRFVFMAGLIWVQVAASGLDDLFKRSRAAAWGLALWALSVNLWAASAWLAQNYENPAFFQGIPLPRPGWGRLVVDFSRPPRPPLQWLSFPLTQGRHTLLIPTSAVEGYFFRGTLYSQYGIGAQRLLAKLAFYSTPLPPLKPRCPLLRSWGLTWILSTIDGGFQWENLGPALRHWTVTRVTPAPDESAENQWAARNDWLPFEEAVLAAPVAPGLGSRPAQVVSVSDSPDEQTLQTSGEASLLITSDNWDPGWECTVDNQPAPQLRANVALKACLVPAGNHQVRWRYRVTWIPRACQLVALGLLLIVLAAGLHRFLHIPMAKAPPPDQL